MTRRAAFAVVLSLAFLAGCGGSSNTDRTANAIRAARLGGAYGLFPRKPGSRSCRIPAGGVVSHLVAGTCSTRVVLTTNGSAQVTFVETWGHGAARHGWEFWVSHTGRITRHRDFGDVPPQSAV